MKRPEQTLRKKLLHRAGRAVADFGMIEEGDRVMVCLSGGKDSYTLLTLLQDLRRRAPVRFDLLAVHLDQKQPGFPSATVAEYLARQGVPFRVVERDTYSVVKSKVAEGETACSLCSRLRRGVLYNVAVEEGCGKIALGHHADDAVATFMLNFFFEGSPRSMPPLLRSTDGRNVVIRPMIYCWEADIAAFAKLMEYPVVPCTFCGSQKDLQRKRMARLVDDLEKEVPEIRHSMLAALGKMDFGAAKGAEAGSAAKGEADAALRVI